MSDYYFDATLGDDVTGDGSIGNPWETIAKVNSTSHVAGGTANFKRGETWSGTELGCDNNGSEGSYITYQAYGSGDLPIITNSGSSEVHTNTIKITADYVKLKYLEVQGHPYNRGISISSGADYAIAEYCDINGCDFGIETSGDHGEFRYNDFYDLLMLINAGQGGDQGAVAVQIRGSNNEIHHNTMLRCRAESIDYGYDGGGLEFYITANQTGNEFHHNWVEECNGGFETGGTSTDHTLSDTKIYYNVFLNNYASLCVLHISGGFAMSISNFQVYNNTIIETMGHDPFKYEYIVISTDAGSDFIFKNNIMYVDDYWYIKNGGTWTHEYNCYYGTYDSLGFTKSTGEIEQDPKFVNVGGEDFHLESDSPCRNVGTDLSLTPDYDGITVPQETNPAIGAFEYLTTQTISAVGNISSIEAFGGSLLYRLNRLYDKGREAFLGGDIDFASDTIKAVLVDGADYTLDLAADEFLDDIPAAAQVAISDALSGKSVTLGVANASDLTISGVSGDQFEYIVLFKDTGDSTTSPLIMCIDSAIGLPFTPEGGSIKLKWSNLASKIFKL